MSLADLTQKGENDLIEVKYNLSFITDFKFIEVWHKFFWVLRVYPQSMK